MGVETIESIEILEHSFDKLYLGWSFCKKLLKSPLGMYSKIIKTYMVLQFIADNTKSGHTDLVMISRMSFLLLSEHKTKMLSVPSHYIYYSIVQSLLQIPTYNLS